MTKKIYSIIATHEGDSFRIERVNDGFNAIEVLGILEVAKDEVIAQIKGDIKPTEVIRTVIKD